MTNMFGQGQLSTATYDALLIAWAAQHLQPSVELDVDSYYSPGAPALARDLPFGPLAATAKPGQGERE
jgi:hypothetical protein